MIPTVENRNIVTEDERYVEIYLILCYTTGKCYVGQAVSHILNHGKYRRYGMKRRFRCHISEAFSKKKNQCHYLNNAIRKYGVDNFDVDLLEKCSVEDSDEREAYHIINQKTMFPTGYNLKLGTATTRLSEEGRKRVSAGVHRYYKDQKMARFEGIIIPQDADIDKYIRPLRRKGKQYGWYVYIQRKKADFGGVHITLDVSRQRAEEFVTQLKEQQQAKLLVAGNP